MGPDNPVYRQLFTARFIPEGTPEQFERFNEICRRTTTPEIATTLLEDEPARERVKNEVLRFTGVRSPEVSEDPIFATRSPRKRQILVAIAEGATNKAIGNRLFISDKTFGNHVTKIFEKPGVHSRAEAIVLARDRHLGAAE